MQNGQLKLFSGSAHPELAREIADQLGLSLGRSKLKRFSDSEVSFQIEENIRGTDVFIVPVTADERQPAFLLADQLRRQGLKADTDFEGRSVRALFKAADKRGVKLLVVLGPDEMASGNLKIKDLRSSEELSIPNDASLAATLAERLSS